MRNHLWSVDENEESVLINVLVVGKVGRSLLAEQVLLFHRGATTGDWQRRRSGTALFFFGATLIYRNFAYWILVLILNLCATFYLLAGTAKWYVWVENSSVLGLRFELFLIDTINRVQEILDLLVWSFKLRTLTEWLLLRWDKKRIVNVRYFILYLALTWVLFISFHENIILVVFVKNGFNVF